MPASLGAWVHGICTEGVVAVSCNRTSVPEKNVYVPLRPLRDSVLWDLFPLRLFLKTVGEKQLKQ